jgi:enamine deaminase RidA (YjgF/YER057c/UK114 family)
VKRWLLAASALLLAGPALALAQQSSAGAANLAPNGFDAGDYVYISGQGPQRADGSTPADFPGQARQCLEKIQKVVEESGLSMEHVVYVQVYLEDTNRYRELNEVFAATFPHDPPARAVLGVAHVPEPPLQMTAVAVRDLKGKQAVSVPNVAPDKGYSPGILTSDRLFVSAMPGSETSNGSVPQDPAAQVTLALDRLNAVVQAAGLSLANMVFVNPYLTTDLPARVMNKLYAGRFEFGNTPARATIEVSSLPEGAHIAFTGVAVRDLSRRKPVRPKNMPPSPTASPCVFAGDTLYCSAKSGFIPGPNGGVFTASVADQTRQTMRNLLDNLEEAEMNYGQVVSTTIYLDDLKDESLFANVYRKYFKVALPAQTVVQQIAPVERKADEEGHYPELEQASLIAVRNGTAKALQ